MNNITAISIGDINGIGIDILIKFWKKNKQTKFVLFTNKSILINYLKKRNIKIKVNVTNNQLDKLSKLNYKEFLNIYDFSAKNIEENTYYALYYSYYLTKRNLFNGILTLPLNKERIKKKINSKFIGQTEFFEQIDKKRIANMIFIKNKLIISPLSTHIEIKKINKIFSNTKLIYNKILSIYNTLTIDFNIKNPRIAISGINPHAGEKGTIGKEEIKFLNPIIKRLNKININIIGPISADSLLTKKNLKKYDCFLFAYHDQALIPFKIFSNYSGTNYTGGLGIIRVSPDHGTAYDMVGKSNIEINSLINSFKLIKKISNNRKKNIASS